MSSIYNQTTHILFPQPEARASRHSKYYFETASYSCQLYKNTEKKVKKRNAPNQQFFFSTQKYCEVFRWIRWDICGKLTKFIQSLSYVNDANDSEEIVIRIMLLPPWVNEDHESIDRV